MWLEAVLYLLSHAGRWVSAQELGDHVYRGVYSPSAPYVLVHRARMAGVKIESGPFGYRIGRSDRPLCERCGRLLVEYPQERVCYSCVGTSFVDLEVGRADSSGARSGQHWTADEIQFVIEHDSTMSLEELGLALGRTASAVRGLRASLGLRRKPYVRWLPQKTKTGEVG